MKENRVNELMNSINAFGKETYYKSELLDEMFKLQREIVQLTFNEDHAITSNLKIWDVEKHLEQMNQQCGNIADEELKRFKEESKILCNRIKAEISGNRGEYKAFKALEYVHSENIILKNVELKDGEIRTELDAVVITPAGITIVEVKNTGRDIFIDENGDYFRTGEFLRWDCNIAQKMDLKEELLARELTRGGFENMSINRVVVFTDNRIQVQNKYTKICTCFVSQLANIIDSFAEENLMNTETLKTVEKIIKNAEEKEAYPFDFDVNQYKKDFAVLMAALEEASEKRDMDFEEDVQEKKISFKEVIKIMIESGFAKYVGRVVAGIVISIITAVVFNNIRK